MGQEHLCEVIASCSTISSSPWHHPEGHRKSGGDTRIKRQEARCALCRWRSGVPGTWGPAVKLHSGSRRDQRGSGVECPTSVEPRRSQPPSSGWRDGWKVTVWMSICSSFGFRTRFGSWGRQPSMSWSRACIEERGPLSRGARSRAGVKLPRHTLCAARSWQSGVWEEGGRVTFRAALVEDALALRPSWRGGKSFPVITLKRRWAWGGKGWTGAWEGGWGFPF